MALIASAINLGAVVLHMNWGLLRLHLAVVLRHRGVAYDVLTLGSHSKGTCHSRGRLTSSLRHRAISALGKGTVVKTYRRSLLRKVIRVLLFAPRRVKVVVAVANLEDYALVLVAGVHSRRMCQH